MARPSVCRLTAALAIVSALALVSSRLPVADAARPLADSSACESCLVAAHVLYDAIGDPYVETKMVGGFFAWSCALDVPRLSRSNVFASRPSSSSLLLLITPHDPCLIQPQPQAEFLITSICPNFEDKKSVSFFFSVSDRRRRARALAPRPSLASHARKTKHN